MNQRSSMSHSGHSGGGLNHGLHNWGVVDSAGNRQSKGGLSEGKGSNWSRSNSSNRSWSNSSNWSWSNSSNRSWSNSSNRSNSPQGSKWSREDWGSNDWGSLANRVNETILEI